MPWALRSDHPRRQLMPQATRSAWQTRSHAPGASIARHRRRVRHRGHKASRRHPSHPDRPVSTDASPGADPRAYEDRSSAVLRDGMPTRLRAGRSGARSIHRQRLEGLGGMGHSASGGLFPNKMERYSTRLIADGSSVGSADTLDGLVLAARTRDAAPTATSSRGGTTRNRACSCITPPFWFATPSSPHRPSGREPTGPAG